MPYSNPQVDGYAQPKFGGKSDSKQDAFYQPITIPAATLEMTVCFASYFRTLPPVISDSPVTSVTRLVNYGKAYADSQCVLLFNSIWLALEYLLQNRLLLTSDQRVGWPFLPVSRVSRNTPRYVLSTNTKQREILEQ